MARSRLAVIVLGLGVALVAILAVGASAQSGKEPTRRPGAKDVGAADPS